ncbi:XIAP-associated factor 1 isoform X2 [Erinaceus europaeus]|uniref:XIAP-associated factor 1 isoform X2 n=1 Tax=Erinaceus europaeus TaxID=9365 RepID=A0ABM3WW93_ERIEU|nr:XIAP-associated factor 1 isoform X2 [Erinaceus europaeus]
MEGDFQVCRNCKKNVASSNLLLHEAHCLRFLAPCPKSKELIPKEKTEDHCKPGHGQVDYAESQQNGQNHSLESHKATEYQEHPLECQFRELAMHLGKLETHERHCDDQTKQRPECSRDMVLGGQAQHRDNPRECEEFLLRKGQRISAPERRTHYHFHNQMLSGKKDIHHMGKCHPKESVKYFPHKNSRIPPPPLSNEMAEKDVRPKEKNSNRFYRPSKNSTKRVPKDINNTMDLPWKLGYQPKDEAAYNILKRCSQCGILLPLPTLNQHQGKCRLLASTKRNASEKFQLDWKRKDTTDLRELVS